MTAWPKEARLLGEAGLLTIESDAPRPHETTGSARWRQPQAPSRPRALARGRRMARRAAGAACHAAGVRQGDVHTRNILVQMPARGDSGYQIAPGNQSAFRLYLIDLSSVRFSGPLGWARSGEQLGLLCAALGRHSTLRECWR